MERRKALKNIAFSFGCVISTPTFISILTSCTNETDTKTYLFLSENEALIIQRLIDNILPKKYFPLAGTMNLTAFLDQMFHFTENKKKKAIFKLGCKEFLGKKSLNNEDFTNIFKKYFNSENKDAIFSLINKKESTVSADEKIDFNLYTFLTKVRYYCIFGYCTTEEFTKEADYYIP